MPLCGANEGGSAPSACARAPWAPFAGSLCRYAAYRKASRSMPSALADRGKAPYAGLPPAGRACVPPPASGQPRSVRPSRRHLHGVCLQNHLVPLRAVHAPIAEDVQRGAPKLLSEMFAQFLREESWLRSAAEAGRGCAPVPAFALSLRRPPASRPQPACFAQPQYAVPPPCRTQSLRRFFQFFISRCA